MLFKITGRNPGGKHLEKLKQSPNYRDHSFQNLSPTPMKPEEVSYWKMFREFLRSHPGTSPVSSLPSVKNDLLVMPAVPSITWFGHSSYLLQVHNRNILVDPVFSGNAAPISFMVKAFRGSNIYSAADLPFIDILVLTHDHYDHLDYHTIRKIKNKTGRIICSLGMRSHLVYWGVDDGIITELDWWQSSAIDANTNIIAAPARHFSGRGLKRGKTFWSSFIFQSNGLKIYIGGDSGYDSHFAGIGQRYGPFDLAILETGQYNSMWPLIHMMPEEAVQAAMDLQARILLPVHWGKFRLGMHPWNEPVIRVLDAAQISGLPVLTPRIGETVTIGQATSKDAWWKED